RQGELGLQPGRGRPHSPLQNRESGVVRRRRALGPPRPARRVSRPAARLFMSRDSATGNRQNREQGMAQQEAVRSPAGQAKKQRSGILSILGPGLITGASDDDPSGIATYSQAGAQFGYATAWVMLFTWPLMCAIQEISARIGRVTGKGIAANLRDHYSKPLLYGIVALLLVANFINLGADLG